MHISTIWAVLSACLIQLGDSVTLRGGQVNSGSIIEATESSIKSNEAGTVSHSVDIHERSLAVTTYAVDQYPRMYLRWGGDMTTCLAFDGDDIKVGDCNDNYENKKWFFDGHNRLHTERNADKNERCVQKRDDSKLEIKDCSNSDDQKWTYDSDYGLLKPFEKSTKCAKVKSNRLWVETCNADSKSNDKDFFLIDNTKVINIHSAKNTNKCLTLADGQTESSKSKVKNSSNGCDNDTKRKWYMDPDGKIHTAKDYNSCLHFSGSFSYPIVFQCNNADTWTWTKFGMLQQGDTTNCLKDKDDNDYKIILELCAVVG